MSTHPMIDSTGRTGIVGRMIGRLLSSAIRSTMEDVLREPLHDLNSGQARLELRLDESNRQIMALGARLDSRIDAPGSDPTNGSVIGTAGSA